MATLQDYMRGRKRAYLKAENVSPAWIKSPPKILELTNKAFKLFFDAWNGLGTASLKIRTKMEMDLTDAAAIVGENPVVFGVDIPSLRIVQK